MSRGLLNGQDARKKKEYFVNLGPGRKFRSIR